MRLAAVLITAAIVVLYLLVLDFAFDREDRRMEQTLTTTTERLMP